MNRNLLLLALFMPIIGFAQNVNRIDSEKFPIDSLNALIDSLRNSKSQAIDTTIIKVDKLDEVLNKRSTNNWEKFLPSLMALLTVIISSGVAYRIGIRAAKVQEENVERQIKTQAAIAADQLDIPGGKLNKRQ